MRTREGNKDKDIINAAIKVFATYGYHKSKISKIAEEADVATGSVYVYYKNKEDLLLKIFESLWEQIYSEFQSLAKKSVLSPVEKVDAIIDIIFDLFTSNPNMALVFVNEQNQLQHDSGKDFTNYYNKYLELIRVVVEEGMKKKYFTPDIDLTIFSHFVFGAVRNMLHSWARDPEAFPINKIRQDVKYIIKYGIQI